MYREVDPTLFEEYEDIAGIQKIPRSHRQFGAVGLRARGIRLPAREKKAPIGYKMPDASDPLGAISREQVIDTMESFAAEAALYDSNPPVESLFLLIPSR